VLDLANNFSDHRPISIVFDLPFSNVANNNSKRFAVRWDKCDLEAYYEATRVHCSEIFIDHGYTLCCNNSCNDITHREAISSHYNQIVMAITAAANCTVPKIPCSSLWTEELDELKSDSVFCYNMWRDAGSPSSG